MSQLEHKGISLAWRFVIWFVIICLLPLAGYGYLSVWQNEKALRKEALGRMSQLADKKTLQIREYLAERAQHAELMARSVLVEQSLSDLSHAYARHGAGSAEYRRAVKPFEKSFAAYIGRGEEGLFYDAFLITPQGEIIYTYKREPDFATNLGNYPMRGTQLALAFRESRMTLESSISDLEHYAPSNQPAAFVSAPIIREGRLLGVVAFQLDSQRIYQISMDGIGLGATGETTLAKRAGPDEAVYIAPLRRDPQAAKQHKIDLKTGAAPIRRALAGQYGSGVEQDYAGKQVVAAWRYLPELRWGVVVKMDEDEVFASLYRQQEILVESLLALMLLAGALAFYFGRRLVLSLRSFALSAGEIAAGNLDKRVDESRSDEIGMLGHAFNRMTENLQVLTRSLEDRIEERTRELSMSNEQLQEEIIEREHIEKALRESREFFLILSAASPVGIFRTDAAGDCVYVNQRWCEIAGVGPEQAMGTGWYSAIHPDDREKVHAEWAASVREQRSFSLEYRFRQPDSQTAWVYGQTTATHADSGGVSGYVGTITDITERRKLAEALQMTRIGVDRSLDSLFWIAADARIVDVNEAPCRALGYTREELLRLTVADIDVNYQPEIWARHFDDLRQKNSIVFESTQRSRDGRLIPVEIGANYFKLGNEEYDFAVVRDITERKQAERLLIIHKQVLEASTDGFWMVDMLGNLLMANRAYAGMSGYSVEELQHMHISQLEAKEKSVEEVKSHIEKIIAQGHDQFATRHRHRDGHEIDIEVTTVFMPDIQQFAAFLRDVTERKRSEEELARTKERYDFATAVGKVGTWDWHPLTGELAWNDETFRLLGLMPGAVIPTFELFMEVVHPDDREFISAAVQAALYEKKPYSVDCRLVAGNEELTYCHVEGKAEFDDAGKPARMLGTIQDVTGRKLAQLELQHSQDLLNEAQRLGQLGSWELNLAGGELRWSDEIFRIFELDPARFLPTYENFLNVIHPDDRDKVNQAYTQSLANRQGYDIVHRLRMADGRIKWVREHCTSEFDKSGKPLRSVGAVQDITEQYLAAEQLRVAAATFETHEAIMITDVSANIIRVNRAFTDITGYSQEEVLGKNPRILSSGRQDKAFYAAMWQQLLQSGSWTGEIWDKRKNGQVYPKWLTITAVKDGQGVTTEYVSIFSDITSRKQAEDEIRNLAFYDALTGLPNRRLMLDRFRLALSVSARSRQYGAVLFLDMDKFKTLNDTLGHDHGDLLLIEVAHRIQICVREMDTVARLGGDEFVVLVEEISANANEASQKVALIAEKIRMSLSAPYQLKDHRYHSSPSIGVCLYRGSRESVDDLLKHADLAMYQAKDSGRNAVRFFDPAMQLAVEAHAATESDLRQAISGNQLRLHYQVQIDSDHRPLGAEALLRWVHPVRGMISPAQFIPIAEESSLILEIGGWVLNTACQQLALWGRSEQTRDLELAINVSAQQFGLADFVRQVEEAVERHGINPERLKLELTESVVLKDVADVVAKMHALKAIGVKLSLDDFGTGYSSLAYLKKLPLDQIKIDQSFVRDATTDPNDAVMVKTIIDMAQNFRLNVIAEGVETDAQLAFLRKNGCMAFQGYLFSKPVSAMEFEVLLQRLSE